jgi:hypothetical protein
VTRHQQNDRKCEKIQELIHEDRRRTIHELADTIRISYGVSQEILTENLNMRHTAMNFVPRLLTNDQKHRHVIVCLELRERANKSITFISPDLAPCDFALFPKLKMKLKGQRFETVSDIQRESQAELNSIGK